MKVTEGYMPYLGYKTYYRIVGEKSETKLPIVLIHGGPGSTHNYFELLDELASDGRQVIMYDQLGCGLSSIPTDKSLWTAKTWINELIALREYLNLEEVHLLGQSWGGMLVIQYMCDFKPSGIASIILSSTLSSSKLWGEEQHRLIQFLSKKDQLAIKEAERTGDYTSDAYLNANAVFMKRHAGDDPSECLSEPLRRAKKLGRESYVVAWGPNEYTPSGTLKEFDYTDKLKDISVPTLIISGSNDLCTPVVAKTMFDEIDQATWKLFKNSRHMPFVDEKKGYLDLMQKWLNEHY